jgi:hypothetical protein
VASAEVAVVANHAAIRSPFVFDLNNTAYLLLALPFAAFPRFAPARDFEADACFLMAVFWAGATLRSGFLAAI